MHDPGFLWVDLELDWLVHRTGIFPFPFPSCKLTHRAFGQVAEVTAVTVRGVSGGVA